MIRLVIFQHIKSQHGVLVFEFREAPLPFQISNQLIEDLKIIYRLKPLLEERGWKMKESTKLDD
jgi:hypothetical protein